MSSEPVIALEGVGKAYPPWAGRGRSLREIIGARVGRRAPRPSPAPSLTDITLSVAAGECVGLIGGNGSGKSTLLRVASGLTRPTSGTARVPAGTAAVLTLGEAFSPDLTGTENAITTAIVSGFTPRQARDLLPEILAYAEVEEAADHPVRTYSEGMKLRLAFAVVAQLRPTALLLDEVMAVGDLSFQRKSAARVRRAREDGAAVLLATHDLSRLTDECDRAVWLRHGRIHRTGPPDEVVAAYEQAMMDETIHRTPAGGDGEAGTRVGSGEARVEEIELNGVAASDARLVVRPGDPLEVRMALHAERALPVPPVVVVVIVDEAGTTCCSLSTEAGAPLLPDTAGRHPMSLTIDRLDLAPGRYDVEVGAYRNDWDYAYDLHCGRYELRVLGSHPTHGVLAPPHRWGPA